MSGPLLEARNVTRRYRARTGLGRPREHVEAVTDVTLSISPGETVGLVGESGSGKSTLGRLLLALEPPDAGEVRFEGAAIRDFEGERLRAFRRAVQVVFQDPYASLNPRLTVGGALREVLAVHRIARAEEASERVGRLLERVGLDAASANRYPHEFSGGQRQRIGIARALSVEPKLLVADEPVSALDVSVQAKVLGLLGELRRDLGLAYLFISHDLAVVRQVCDRVAVLHRGRIVEEAPTERLFDHPEDPYTRSLIDAVPRLARSAERSA